jgi:branched-chain amino acid transport system ATP-binding protein
MNLLEVSGLHVSYGGIRAVKGIDLTVAAGELVCLIGANGAGKTTTLKAICGLMPAAAGSIRYQGEDTAGVAYFELPRRGLVLVPEGRGIFPQLTVEENLAMGGYTRGDSTAIKRDIERSYTLFPRLAERRLQSGGTLSGGEQQMLAIARALMAEPNLLVLDEPSMGLAPIIVQKVFEVIATIRKEGVTILLVEQNARLALELADRAYVMETGTITLAGEAKTLLADERVKKAYLGE